MIISAITITAISNFNVTTMSSIKYYYFVLAIKNHSCY